MTVIAAPSSLASENKMSIEITPGRILAAVTVALSAWIVHAFIPAMLAACVLAVASWPLYARFRARLPRRFVGAGAVAFTCVLAVFVLAPMVFACGSLLTEARNLIAGFAASDGRGRVVLEGLAHVPVLGPWVAARWTSELAHPGGLLALTRGADTTAMLGVAQSLGQFAARHAVLVAFTILLLVFLFHAGEALARDATRALHGAIGEPAQRYVDVATRAVRAAVNSMLVVGLFDALATAFAYALAGTPRALEWAAITGALAAVPFLGYAAVAALAVELALQGAAASAMLALGLGCAVLLCGDKVVRPMVARGGIRLPFVWVLIGCVGGFEVLGVTGLVIGPVVLSLAREMAEQRRTGVD